MLTSTPTLETTSPSLTGSACDEALETSNTCPKLEYLNRAPDLRATRNVPFYTRKWFLGIAGIAAIGIPALAATDPWSVTSQPDKAGLAPSSPPLMPFENAKENFPGSAFYYLDEDLEPSQLGDGIYSDAEEPSHNPIANIGPAARPFKLDGAYIDRTRALQCLTAAIYYEAASEPDAGQRAVAQVVLNRVAHPAYPNTVCGVVYEGSERSTGCQFSFTCDGSLARRPMRMFWERAQDKARAALAGSIYTPVGLATHYHTVQVSPYWAPSLNYLGTIGAHRFYKFRGGAGQANAFRFAYLGGEPIAAPHPRALTLNSEAPSALTDPIAIQQAYSNSIPASDIQNGVGRASAPTPKPALYSAPASPPNYTAQVEERGGDSLYRAHSLPESTGLRAEFANSGQWIAQPPN